MVVAAALTLATALIVRLACLPFPAFPDERMHARAAAYYREHWLPPGVSDLLLPYLDGLWGASYLQTWPPQAVYFISGKLSSMLFFSEENLWVLMRMFNVTLWLGLAAFAWWHRARLPAVFIAGATGQLWYVFSYAASDAFTTLVVIAALWQLCSHDGRARRFLSGKGSETSLLVTAGTWVLLALSKTTNMFALLLAMVRTVLLAWNQRAWKRLLAAAALVTVGVLPFLVADAVRSGPDRKAKMEAYTETLAAPPFKPSGHHASTVHFSLALRERGVPWEALLHRPWRWVDMAGMSFLGLYGPMSILMPNWLYRGQAICWMLLLGLITMALARASRQVQTFSFVALLTAVALVLASFWHSWNYDFQPQGRYLFSIIAIVSGVWLEVEDSVHRAAQVVLAVLLGLNLISLAFGASVLVSAA